jgi:hypothetical protein
MPSLSELAAPGVRFVELEREGVELLERDVVVVVLPRLAQPALDGVAVALGEVVEHVPLFVLHAALNGDIVPEHLADRFAEGFGAVDHEQQPLLDV